MQELRIRGSANKLPQDPRHLRACLDAVLKRGPIKSRSEMEWLRREIEELAGLEDLSKEIDPDFRIAFEQTISAKLLMLERASAPKLADHIPEVLQIQRRILGGFLRTTVKNDFSEHRNIEHHNRTWHQRYWHKIKAEVQAVPCWCRYSELTAEDLLACDKPRDILLQILSVIHRIESVETVSTLLTQRTF